MSTLDRRDSDEGNSSGPDSPAQRGLFSDDDDDSRPGPDNDRDTAGAEARNSDEEEAEEERKRAERKKKEDERKKKKGPVRRQMISEDMLTGPKGVSKLPEIFKDFKFKGKGQEQEDLGLILAKLEHWIHNLHPKQPFDQSLQRIEFLGLKRKVVKTNLKRIRMGLQDDFPVVLNEEEEDNLPDFDNEEFPDEIPEEVPASSSIQAVPSEDIDFGTNSEEGPNQVTGAGTSSSAAVIPIPASASGFPDDDEFPDEDEFMDIMNQERMETEMLDTDM